MKLDGLIVYEENKPKVTCALKNGRIDYVDLTEWTFADNFLGFLIGVKFFEWCASTYPTPRTKEEIPVWFLLSCAIQMKLHTTASFHALPGILRSGSVLTRMKFNVGGKNGGFNLKNKNPRESPIHQDTLRKFFKVKEPQKMQDWFNQDVMKWFRRHRGFDKAGIFLLDKTYIFVPDNENYEKADLLPFDKDDNLVSTKNMTEEEKKGVIWRYCYSLTTLLHICEVEGESVFFVAGAKLSGGKESGLTAGEEIVDKFVETIGKGVIKKIIMDRGFLDGPMITKWKKNYKIDSLVPLKMNMCALTDALSLTLIEKDSWTLHREEKDDGGNVIVREEVSGKRNISSWDECKVPLYVALMKRTQPGKEEDIWGLASTMEYDKAEAAFEDYNRRTQIEERYRQFKEFWYLCKFTSTSFSLVTHHIFFTLLVYTLVQFYLLRRNFHPQAAKTINSWRKEEELGTNAVIVYAEESFATYDVDEYGIILLKLKEESRRRLLKWMSAFQERKVRSP